MSVTEDTSLGIGDLAALTGVPVRTIRFHCDAGLLDAGRSACRVRRPGIRARGAWFR
ncbi:MerR family transcriptional regulator [Actinomadura sp. 3N508]|uniref:MerR family transcriptional regulator n=1 Tax=Actinomadura sp. 3N508 TaxID=3375153 RepID=UPI0037B3273A